MAWVVYASDNKTSGAYADLPTARRVAQKEANRTGRSAIVYPTSRTGRAKGKTHHVKPSTSKNPGLSIKVKPGTSTESRKKAQAMADRTGQPVSLLHPFYKGGEYWNKKKMVWTTYDTVYPSKKNSMHRHSRRTNPGGPLDTDAARELDNYISSDGQLYRQQYKPIQTNLITKMARGVYNHAGAVKLFGHLMETGAKKYIREHGSPGDQWHVMFSPATRKSVAESFAKHFETEANLGNYDSYLPKKYADWRLKKNPNRLVDVIVRKNGKTFKAKAKYDAAQRRVRVFVNPRVAQSINPSPLRQRYDVVVFKLGKAKGQRGIDPGWFYGKNVWDYPLGGPYKTKTLAKKAARAAGYSPDPIGVSE